MIDPKLFGKRYIALVRCSTMGQADTSIDDQIRLIDCFATENGMVKTDEARLEGVSGSIAKNMDDAIAALIRRKAEKNDFDVILVQDASRFTRGGAMHASKLRYDLGEAGIEVIGALGYMPKSDFSEVKDAMESMVARQQAKSISAGVARGSQSALEQGRKAHCSFAPYGLDKRYQSASGQPLHVIRNLADGTQQRLDASTGELLDTYGRNDRTGAPRHYRKQKDERVVLIAGAPEAVVTVHRIYRRYFLDGWGYWRIAVELNNMKVPSPTGLDWTMASVKTILDNSVYTGRGVTNRTTMAIFNCRNAAMPKEVVPGRRTLCGRPAQRLRPSEDWVIISYPELIEFLPSEVRSQAIVHHAAILDGLSGGRQRLPRDKHVNSTFILKGLLKTKEGFPMSGRRKGKASSQKRYYAVATAYSAPRDGDHLRTLVPADPIEFIMLNQLKALLLDMPGLRDELLKETKAELARCNGGAEERAKLEAEIALIDRRVTLALDQLDGGNEVALRQKLAQFKVQRRELDERVSAMAAPIVYTEQQVNSDVDAMIAHCQEQADGLSHLPSAHIRELLDLMVESLTVDLQTMEVRYVLRIPTWGQAAWAAAGAAQPMGLGSTSVYKSAAEAHPPTVARRECRFWLRRRAA